MALEISGISDYSNYRQTLDYLSGLGPVIEVHLRAVNDDIIRVDLDSEANVDRFQSILGLDDKLLPIDEGFAPTLPAWQRIPKGSVENPLKLRWSS